MALIRALVVFSVLICCWLPQSAAQTARPPAAFSPLSTDGVVREMVERNRRRIQALLSFQGTRYYTLEYTGFPGRRYAEMVVNVSYHAPNTKEFTIVSQAGSGWLVDHVLKKLLDSEKEGTRDRSRMDLTPENYDFSLIGFENSPTGGSYVLAVEPKTSYKYLYRGKIWVDAADFAIKHLEAEPAVNPSFWTKKSEIQSSYTKVGSFWLPSENHTVTSVRLGGRAVLTIQYRDYRITGARRVAQSTSATDGRASASPSEER